MNEFDELNAYIERLRKALYFIAEDYSTDNPKYINPCSIAESALAETPPQSLNHIRAPLQKENDELKFTLNCAKDINAALETENDELKAYIQRLRDEYEEAQGQWGGDYLWKKWDKDKILEETPTQSLNHIRAQVEEETIQADIEFLDDMACEHSGNLNNRPRKYKEQADE